MGRYAFSSELTISINKDLMTVFDEESVQILICKKLIRFHQH